MTSGRSATREWKQYAACLLGLWALLLGVYALAGSFHAEFSGPDEAAYVVSGVMVREYFTGALWSGQSPLLFAQQYYAHYPKVAIGHWPPTYFLVEAGWLMITGLSRPAILALSALTSAVLALVTVFIARREGLRWTMAATAGVVVALLPASLEPLIEIGSDVFTGLAMLVAALCGQRWLARPSTRECVILGVAMAVAILCKGTAFALLLLPPLALLLATKRVSSLWTAQVWIPIGIALILVFPWYYYAHVLLQGSVVPGPVQPLANEIVPGLKRSMFDAMWYAARANLSSLVTLGGIGLSVLGLFSIRFRWYRRWPALIALMVAMWVFLSVVSPHTSSRHFVHLIPIVVLAAALAARELTPRLQEVVLLSALGIAHLKSPVPPKPAYGFVPAVAWMVQDKSMPADRILVSSNFVGEGALISEFALYEPAPARTIVRASKVLQQSTWMGNEFQLLVHSATDVKNVLEQNRTNLVVIHESPAQPPSAYKAYLDEALADWDCIHVFGEVSIYQRGRSGN